MKNDNLSKIIVAISIELFIVAGLLAIFFHLSTPDKTQNIIINNVQEVTTPVVEQVVPETVVVSTPVVRTQQEIDAAVILKMQSISTYRVSYNTAGYIYRIIKEKCKMYNAPINYVWGMSAQESRFLPTAHNRRTNATGLLQICPLALQDYNDWNGTHYTMEDMYNIELNIEVGVWNLMQQAYYLRREPTVTYKDCVIAFNTGVGDFKLYKNDWLNNWNPKEKRYYEYFVKVNEYSSQFVEILSGGGEF